MEAVTVEVGGGVFACKTTYSVLLAEGCGGGGGDATSASAAGREASTAAAAAASVQWLCRPWRRPWRWRRRRVAEPPDAGCASRLHTATGGGAGHRGPPRSTRTTTVMAPMGVGVLWLATLRSGGSPVWAVEGGWRGWVEEWLGGGGGQVKGVEMRWGVEFVASWPG